MAQHLGKVLITTLGSAIAGPTGSMIGGLMGGLLQIVLPGPAGFIGAVVGNIAAEAIRNTGKRVSEKITPGEKQTINRDLQAAFRDSFRETLYDLGGEPCFKDEWRARPRDVANHLVFPKTSAGERLWHDRRDLASQVVDLFQGLRNELDRGRLLPIEPPADEPAASVYKYLEANTPGELSGIFFDEIVSPFFTPYRSLLQEVPELEPHLRRYLLDRMLIHLGEMLKKRDAAWRSFNRLVMEELRDRARSLSEGQAEILSRLNTLLDEKNGKGLDSWSDGMAELIAATGSIEKKVDEGFETILHRVVEQHGEVMDRLERLTRATDRIEFKVDRVLQYLEDGRYVIHGEATIPLSKPPAPGEPPFKGLQHYTESDADIFFGREILTAQLIKRLKEERFLAVVAGSGSGKSSIVRAGVIAALKRGEALAEGITPPEGSSKWQIHIIKPSDHPFESLAASLTREIGSISAAATLAQEMRGNPRGFLLASRQALERSGKSHLLLMVDQFEEVFTLCLDKGERAAFIDNLLEAVDEKYHSNEISVIITLRADFYSYCAEHANLRSALERHQAYIGPMTREELRRAIEEPAERNGWKFEPGLVDVILNDMGSEPGALPLLSHALLETWHRRHGHTMTLESYAESGGVRGAIARTAESVFRSQLTPNQQIIAKNIFLRLTRLGEDTQDTSRRVTLGELLSAPETYSEVNTVLQILADARLITLGEDTAEVVHEALIREWPTLRQWLDVDREGLLIQRRLTETAQEWRRLKKDQSLLYRGLRLAEAQEWIKTHPDQLNALELEFLTRSIELAENEQLERDAQRHRELEAARKLAETEKKRAQEQKLAADRLRRNNRIITGVGIVAGMAAIAALVGAILAFISWQTALAQARVANSGRLAALSTSHLNDQLDLSLLLAVESIRVSDQPPSRSSLMTAVNHSPFLRQILHGHKEGIMRALYSPDGKYIYTASQEGMIRRWNAVTGQPEGTPMTGITEGLTSMDISPDGKHLAASSLDGKIFLWELEKGNLVKQSERIYSLTTTLVFSPNSKGIAAASADGRIVILDASSLEIIAELNSPHKSRIEVMVFSPDKKYLASGGEEGEIYLWDLDQLDAPTAELKKHTKRVWSLTFTTDSKLLISASSDASIILWDVAARKLAEKQLSPTLKHTEAVAGVAVSPNGLFLASGSFDDSVIIWDLASGNALGKLLPGRTGGVWCLGFSPDNAFLVSGSRDGSAHVWDLSGKTSSSTSIGGMKGSVNVVRFTPDGRILVTANCARTDKDRNCLESEISFFNFATRQLSGEPILTQNKDIFALTFSSDGKLLATGNMDGSIHVWDVTTRQMKINPLMGHTDGIQALAFSPNGKVLISGSWDKTIRFWDVVTGKPLGEPLIGHKEWVSALVFSPDGKMFFSGSYDNTIQMWNTATRKPVGQPQRLSRSAVTSLAFHPKRNLLAIGWGDTILVEWDLTKGEPIGTPRRAYSTFVNDITFSPNGKMLATAGNDGGMRLWDVDSWQPIGQPLPLIRLPDAKLYSVSFSPDNKYLAVAGAQREVVIWNIDQELWKNTACFRAGRNLTKEEWRLYLPGETYRATCSQYPEGE